MGLITTGTDHTLAIRRARLDGADTAQIEHRQREVISMQSLYTGSSIDADDRLYHHVFKRGSAKENDPPTLVHEQMQKYALFLWQANPLARRFIDITVDFTVGEPARIRARTERVRDAILRFWENDHNNMPKRISQFSYDVARMGEAVYQLSLRKDHTLLLGRIEPMHIAEVLVDPYDYGNPTDILLKPSFFTQNTGETPEEFQSRMRLSLLHDVSDSGRRPSFGGNTVLFQTNKYPGSTRGLSDLLPLINWMDVIERFLANIAERLTYTGQYFYDITLTGASRHEIDEYEKLVLSKPAHPGAYRVHSDKVKWEIPAVNAPSESLSDPLILFMSHILTGAGIPVHWAGGDAGGRQAASDSQDPIFKHLAARQVEIQRFFSRLLSYQINILQDAKLLPVEDSQFLLFFPRIGLRDLQRSGSAAARLLQATSLLVSSGILEAADVKALYMDLIAQMGLGERTGERIAVQEALDTGAWPDKGDQVFAWTSGDEASLESAVSSLEKAAQEIFSSSNMLTASEVARVNTLIRQSAKLIGRSQVDGVHK